MVVDNFSGTRVKRYYNFDGYYECQGLRHINMSVCVLKISWLVFFFAWAVCMLYPDLYHDFTADTFAASAFCSLLTV